MGFFKNLCRIPRFLSLADMRGRLSKSQIGRIGLTTLLSTISSLCKIGASFLFSKAVEAITNDKEESDIGFGIELSTQRLFYLSAIFTGLIYLRSDINKRLLSSIEYDLAWQLSHDMAQQEQQIPLLDLEQNRQSLSLARGNIELCAQLPIAGDEVFSAAIDLLFNLALVAKQCGGVVGSGFAIYAGSNILLLDKFFRCISGVNRKSAKLYQKNQGYLENAYLQSIAATTIRTCDKQPEEIGRNDYLTTEKLDATLEYRCADFFYNVLSKLIQMTPPLLLIGYLSDLDDVFVLMLMGGYSLAVENVKKTTATVTEIFDQRDKINQLMQIESKPEYPLDEIKYQESSTLKLEHIGFSLQNNPIIKDVSFSVEAGDVIAIVGPSGSGKTTLARLIAGLYEENAGSLEINGQALTASERMKQVAYVPQDPYVFPHLTIEGNILYGVKRPSARETFSLFASSQPHDYQQLLEEKNHLEDKWETINSNQLMQQAGLEKLILAKETVCQQRGFSGGEKQRIALARAWAKQAPITIYDEVTSGLDASSEQKVMTTILNNKRTTAIFITHRLLLISKVAKKIIVMDNGAVVETGTHVELLSKNNLYAQLWEEQSKPAEVYYRM